MKKKIFIRFALVLMLSFALIMLIGCDKPIQEKETYAYIVSNRSSYKIAIHGIRRVNISRYEVESVEFNEEMDDRSILRHTEVYKEGDQIDTNDHVQVDEAKYDSSFTTFIFRDKK